ncbi:MAG: peptidylprolyl isomerase [Myxococcales bacterium]|nr:peptidylprolyl isomerase [Myxococcales bacterium]MCB9581242.1 peptidylprolyl isomerase [Polyangiaceae bacterium]
MLKSSIALAVLLSLAAAGCKSEPTSEKASSLTPAKATETAPAEFKARFTTSKGPFTVEVHRDWAPQGADRFYNLVKLGFYDGTRFFRVVPGFVVQWGIHGDGNAVMQHWRGAGLPDDPVRQSNTEGTVTFAMAGKSSRTTQIFVNLADNSRLDEMGFATFGKVVDGMDVVKSLYSGYGQTPDQASIQSQGNAYLEREYPKLDYVKSAEITK